MRVIRIICIIFLSTFPARGEVFGITQNQDISALRVTGRADSDYDPNIQKDSYMYKVNPPNPNPLFVKYKIFGSSKSGICAIYAESMEFKQDDFKSGKDYTSHIRRFITEKYGNGSYVEQPKFWVDDTIKLFFGNHIAFDNTLWSENLNTVERGLRRIFLQNLVRKVAIFYEFDNIDKCISGNNPAVERRGL